jgi:L-ascorbate metabolism protein UlaG (beta-lactamase superfamily)
MAVIAAGQEIAHENIQVKAVEAYNQIKSSTGKIWHLKGSGVGYLITVEEKRIYHAGDTDFIPEMKQLGHVDLALLPIGGTYTMDLNAAVQAALAIQPQVVIPMHHLKANPQEFKIEIEAKSDIQCAVMQIGEPFFLS